MPVLGSLFLPLATEIYAKFLAARTTHGGKRSGPATTVSLHSIIPKIAKISLISPQYMVKHKNH